VETVLGPILAVLLKMGAPWVITAVFCVLFVTERKKNNEVSEKLFQLGMAQVKTDTEFHQTLDQVKKDTEEIRRYQKVGLQ
jgi:hypothetical protein